MSIDFKTVVPQGLELLGSALTASSIGAGPGMVLSGIGALVGHILGVPPTAQNLATGMQSLTPEQQTSLLTLQENNKTQLQAAVIAQQVAQMQADAATAAAELADRQDARKRDAAIVQSGKTNVRADIMVTMDVVGLLGCIIASVVMKLYGDLDVASATLLTTFASYFGLSLRDAHSFEFSSSRSSQNKDEVIRQAITAAVAAPAPKP